MKKFFVVLIVFCGIVLFASCKKDDDKGNFFVFDNTIYPIDSVSLTRLIFSEGTADEQDIYQFIFYSIEPGDTTAFLAGLFDNNTNTLGGNYEAFDQNAPGVTRGIGPFGFFFASGITFETGDPYMTGEGGSMDVSKSDGIYSISFNDISVGDYDDLFDSDNNDDSEYTEAGIVSGRYKGTIDMIKNAISKGSSTNNVIVKSLKQVSE